MVNRYHPYIFHCPFIQQKAVKTCYITMILTKKVRFYSWVIVWILFSIHCAYGQTYPLMDVPIQDLTGRVFKNPNVGGLHAPQFSPIDLNNDGIQDLFVFDRNAFKVLPFIKTGEIGSIEYRYAPEYIQDFPKMIQWALIRDYNNDGVPDIFTCFDDTNIAGNAVAVYQGSRSSDGRLQFKLVNPPNGRARNVLNYLTPSNVYSPVFVQTIDIPAILDIDGDGDMDIISFDSGGQFATYYKNVSLEEGLGLEAFKYVIADPCWGKFQEAQFNDQLTLSTNPIDCSQGLNPRSSGELRHAGTSLNILHLNGDDLYDMLIGDIGSPRMTGLINGGTKENAHITQKVSNFPTFDDRAEIPNFVASYYIDVDGDNMRDLLVTTNDPNNSKNIQHIWFYKNVGSDNHPIFNLIKKDFLIDEMPYFYGGSHPVFVDVNKDGLSDIVIGTNGILEANLIKQNRLVYLKNIGTPTKPSFKIEDLNYLNFGQFDNSNIGRLAPCFGDINGDGALDLLVGTDFAGFIYSENEASANEALKFERISSVFPYVNEASPTFLGQNLKPQIFDTNGDGLPDLVFGKANNREFDMYLNQGTKDEPFFDLNRENNPNSKNYGKIQGSSQLSQSNIAPLFFQSEKDMMLLLGTDNGLINLYRLGQFPYPDSIPLFRGDLGKIYEGRKSVASLADIDNDGFYEMVIGNDRGGIAFYKSDLPVGKTTSTDYNIGVSTIEVWPNPASDYFHITSDQAISRIEIMDINGQNILNVPYSEYISLDAFKNGVYFVILHTKNGLFTKKLVIIKSN